jgi:hypothetical protein
VQKRDDDGVSDQVKKDFEQGLDYKTPQRENGPKPVNTGKVIALKGIAD